MPTSLISCGLSVINNIYFLSVVHPLSLFYDIFWYVAALHSDSDFPFFSLISSALCELFMKSFSMWIFFYIFSQKVKFYCSHLYHYSIWDWLSCLMGGKDWIFFSQYLTQSSQDHLLNSPWLSHWLSCYLICQYPLFIQVSVWMFHCVLFTYLAIFAYYCMVFITRPL